MYKSATTTPILIFSSEDRQRELMLGRLAKIVEDSGLSRGAFADCLGVPSTRFSSYLTGKLKVTDRIIALVCERFGVSERWIRDGIGPVYVASSKRADIDRFYESVLFLFNLLPSETQEAAVGVMRRIIRENKVQKQKRP